MKSALTFPVTLVIACALFLLIFPPAGVQGQGPVLTLYFPILASRPTLLTGIAVVNNDATSAAHVVFTAFKDDGAMKTGPGIVNPALKTIPAGAQIADVVTEIFGDGLTEASGWILMTSDNANVRGFFLLFDPALKVLDGADVGPETPMEAVLPDVTSTIINIVNPNSVNAIATLRLHGRDGAANQISARIIPPMGRLSLPASTLFFGVMPAADNYVSISADRPVVPFALLGDEVKFVAGLRGQDRTSGGTLLYCPQFVNGGGFASEMNIINLEDRPGQVTLRYIRNDGTQIGVPVLRAIPALGMFKIVGPSLFGLPDGGELLVEGYVLIESDGPRVNGSVKFGDPGKLRFQSALPFVAQLRKSVLYSQVAQGVFNFFTGAAILNPNATAITVRIDVFDSAGTLVASGERTIVPFGRVTVVLSEIDPTLSLNEGYFTVTSDGEFASFAVFGTGDLEILSAIPPQIP